MCLCRNGPCPTEGLAEAGVPTDFDFGPELGWVLETLRSFAEIGTRKVEGDYRPENRQLVGV